MKLLEELLKDNIINRSTLVIKRHEYLGLDATQAAFVAKIFVDNNLCKFKRPSLPANTLTIATFTNRSKV